MGQWLSDSGGMQIVMEVLMAEALMAVATTTTPFNWQRAGSK